jgi:uncharacterized membrane protein
LASGAILLYKGFRHSGPVGSVLKFGGLALLFRGQQGYRRLYDALGWKLPEGTVGASKFSLRAQSSIIVARPASELYRIWRNLSNLPVFMDHLLSVTEVDDERSIWVAKLPGGMVAKWDAVIINDVENELIAWSTLEGSGVDSAGSVRFRDEGYGNTRITVILRYDPPADRLGALIGKFLGLDPQKQIERDLRHFKDIMELGNEKKSVPDRVEMR